MFHLPWSRATFGCLKGLNLANEIGWAERPFVYSNCWKAQIPAILVACNETTESCLRMIYLLYKVWFIKISAHDEVIWCGFVETSEDMTVHRDEAD